jgi:hypothetical protein
MTVDGGIYLTVRDMVERSGLPIQTIRQRIKRLNLKPISVDALYPDSAYDAIMAVGHAGRPPKKQEDSLPKDPD